MCRSGREWTEMVLTDEIADEFVRVLSTNLGHNQGFLFLRNESVDEWQTTVNRLLTPAATPLSRPPDDPGQCGGCPRVGGRSGPTRRRWLGATAPRQRSRIGALLQARDPCNRYGRSGLSDGKAGSDGLLTAAD